MAEYRMQQSKHSDFHQKVGVAMMLVKALRYVITIGHAFLMVAAILWLRR